MNKLQIYACAALVLNVLGYVPRIGHVFSLLGFIAAILMYRHLTQEFQLKPITGLYINITVLSLVAVLLAYAGQFTLHTWTIVLGISAYIMGLVIAFLTYRFARCLGKLASQTEYRWFKVAANMSKIAAFSMPILIGFIIQAFSQLIIFISVIAYKPKH